jgi:Diguanylate cyclase, GGDEF domain
VPQSTLHVPAVFERVRDSGTTVVHAEIGNTAPGIGPETTVDAIRGVAGVPIWREGAVAGAICVFDVNPLTLSGAEVRALEDIGARCLSTRLAGHAAADPPPRHTLVAPHDRAEDRVAARSGDHRVPTVMDWPPALLERSGGEFAVARELSRSRREGRQLSVVLFNVSPSGSAGATPEEPPPRLEDVAETLLKAVRQSDLPIRWSVSELLVVLPGLAGPEARVVAERVRAALSAGTKHRIAVSGGVAQLADDERFMDVVDRARQKVSVAVSRGHNRVV